MSGFLFYTEYFFLVYYYFLSYYYKFITNFMGYRY